MLEGETLLVFADDWGVHPSSAQHLFRRFLGRNRVIWVNTVGLRWPRLSRGDLGKMCRKLAHWSGSRPDGGGAAPEVRELLLAPLPLGRAARWLNAGILRRAAQSWLADSPKPPFIVSTLPLTADLALGVADATFVYYAVDDYGSWPGLGGSLVRTLDEAQARRADLIVAASQALAEMHQARAKGKIAYLPHGADVAHFAEARKARAALRTSGASLPVDGVFFGALDERIDRSLLQGIIRARPELRFLLVGPGFAQAAREFGEPNVERREAVAYADLPGLLGNCRVALLPYVGGRFGERLSPLKAREALAAGLPVVATDVPELRAFPRGIHLGRNLEEVLAALDRTRLAVEDVPDLEELAVDSWENRAEQFSELLLTARAARRPV